MTDNEYVMRWYHTTDMENVNGVALVVHGLNIKPERMEPMIILLTDAGIDVLNLSLRGHGQNYDHETGIRANRARLEAFKTVSYDLWFDEVRRAYDRLRKRGRREKVPIFFIGYSLGGLLGADLLAADPDVIFDKMVLLAPALDLHPIHNLMKVLSLFPRLVVLSRVSKYYRSNNGTPMAAYNALFAGMGHFNKAAGPRLNIPALVFFDPQDELVSYYGVKRLIERKGLDQWKFHLINKEPGIKSRLRHLIIDEPSVGQEMWNEMRNVITIHLLY